HEIPTALFFNRLGYDVEFLPCSYDSYIRTPDIKMNGQIWEIKAPKGNAKRTISHCLQKAIKQSSYIIIDTRRTNMVEAKIISHAKREFKVMRKIKMLYIILKSEALLEMEK
ncbi:MAG: hypothetical protein LBH33_01090, partial [Endomicrobium sp.]|nr:hypothetical protein [Endomicrobium sp.]